MKWLFVPTVSNEGDSVEYLELSNTTEFLSGNSVGTEIWSEGESESEGQVRMRVKGIAGTFCLNCDWIDSIMGNDFESLLPLATKEPIPCYGWSDPKEIAAVIRGSRLYC